MKGFVFDKLLVILSFSEVFFGMDGGRLGGKYWKVVYKEYTDKSFTLKKKQTSAETHLGILGKLLHVDLNNYNINNIFNLG